MKRIAVVLFNLGGPDTLDAVQPFLFNLFHDPAIIKLPQPLRYLIARLISGRRAPIANEIYVRLGGGSPILKNTEDQKRALENLLNADGAISCKCFIAMRYWHPFVAETVRQVMQFAPDEIILLPLYPQYSTTTSASSLLSWQEEASRQKLLAPSKIICCYPQQQGFIQALAGKIATAYRNAEKFGTPRILFSAHGLPEKIVKAGDPYPLHCEMTVEALRRALNIPDLDSVLCYQSRVGPLKWIGPATDDEVRRAAKDKKPIVAVPIAFVSDHSETLVELDIEYRHLAQEQGAPYFGFVPAVGAAPAFIAGLAQMVLEAVGAEKTCFSGSGKRVCPVKITNCPCF